MCVTKTEARWEVQSHALQPSDHMHAGTHCIWSQWDHIRYEHRKTKGGKKTWWPTRSPLNKCHMHTHSMNTLDWMTTPWITITFALLGQLTVLCWRQYKTSRANPLSIKIKDTERDCCKLKVNEHAHAGGSLLLLSHNYDIICITLFVFFWYGCMHGHNVSTASRMHHIVHCVNYIT